MTIEDGFRAAWENCWSQMDALKIRTARIRKQTDEHGVLETANRILSGRQCSDGFQELATLGRLDLSLEALTLNRKWGSLFTDDEVNEALNRLMEAGYHFRPRH